jgi:hypothetical protein
MHGRQEGIADWDGQHQTLFIRELSVSNADAGRYECSASNSYRQDQDAVFLQAQDVPQPPVDVRVAFSWKDSRRQWCR